MSTLYISEFANGFSLLGSGQAPIMPQPSLADQKVALSGSSAQSAAFQTGTKAILLSADASCSIVIGLTTSGGPTATTTNFRIPANGAPIAFAVPPGGGYQLAAISN